MKTIQLTKKWQALHRELILAGRYYTARRLLQKVHEARRCNGRASMSLYNNDDWYLAARLDPDCTGYTFKIS